MNPKFKSQNFANRLKSMLKVDFRRMFTMPMFFIMCGVCFVIPILTIVMTSMMATPSVDPVTGQEVMTNTFTNVWQAIGSASDAGMAMDLTGMCNINMMYFLAAVLVSIFVTGDFRSGYSKNLFTVRSKKSEYVISKTFVCFVGCVGILLSYFTGAMIAGAIAGLPFTTGPAGIIGIIMCMISKIFLMGVFVSIYLAAGVVAKKKTWLSLLISFAAGMLMFTMIPMITPIDATIMHVVLCAAGAAMFGVGLGVLSNLVLRKTALV